MPATTKKPKKKFVSKAQKIRDLEALAAPDSGASEGERANALAALEKLRAEEAKVKEDQERWKTATVARLDDPAVGDDYVALLSGCPNLARYSIYNVLFLEAQCVERGIQMRSVDTFKGWITRGRKVRRGESALWMTVHGVRELTPEQRAAGEREDYFYMKKFWFEISQTDPIGAGDEETPGELGPLALPDAAASTEHTAGLLASLREQIERAGHTVTMTPGPAGTVTRDAEARTVTITHPPETVLFDGLLPLLANEVARIEAERRGSRETKPAANEPEVFAMNW